MLPHRESSLAYHQHPTLLGPTLPICLPTAVASFFCYCYYYHYHSQSFLPPRSYPSKHPQITTIHTTAITMVTRPTPTSTNTMDTRTPQNTPAQNAPISSRAQAPSVSDIKEGTWTPTCFEANRTVRLTISEQRTSTAPPPLPSSPRTPASFQ